MSEWWTYTLADLLMFSARSYYRLIELYNVAVWPLQLLAAALGLALLYCARRADERSGRVAAVVLGLCWLWVGWAYHAERYATINTAAPYFAAGFALQGALLILSGRLQAHRDAAGQAVLMLVLLGYPLLALASGRPWRQAELFGIAPDPTAAATLVLLAFTRRASWWLWPVPLLWCAVSGATLWSMHLLSAWLLPSLAVCALIYRYRYSSRGRSG